MIDTEYGLIVSFIDESESFTLGFECGQIWNELQTGRPLIRRLIHTANTAQIRLMAMALNYHGYFESAETEDWSYASLKKREGKTIET